MTNRIGRRADACRPILPGGSLAEGRIVVRMCCMEADLKERILEIVRDTEHFVRLTFSGPARKDEDAWRKIAIQTVRLQSGATLQAIYQGVKREERETLEETDLPTRLDEWLDQGFRRIHVQSTREDLHIRFTRKGKVLVTTGRPSVTELPDPVPHDREKLYPLPAQPPNPFLEAVGITRNGCVRAAMRDKFRQINHFIELLSHASLLREPPDEPLRIVDCGCGRALLTFAAAYWLRHVRGLEVAVTGVDSDAGVLRSARTLLDASGLDDVELIESPIRDVQPSEPPHIVISLHACDTATDEAIERGVRWEAEVLLAAPCCQHELHHELDRADWRAVLQHGVLRERTADIVTDALRAAALRVMGYKADVIEFISPESTAKNLMIRAEKAWAVRQPIAVREYLALRDFWGVRPAIETLLGEPLSRRLSAQA